MDTGINALILFAGSLGMGTGAYALHRSRRKLGAQPQPTPSGPSGRDATDELELLRYENAMLRAEQQRAMSLGKAGERLRDHLAHGGLAGASGGQPDGAGHGTDEGDDAWTALTEATVLRETMLAVCQDLQTAVRNVQVQLSSGVPITELDRRRTDREPHGAAAAEAGVTVTHLSDHTGANQPLVRDASS